MPHERNNSPMTMEDRTMLLTDIDLVNSLRAPIEAYQASFNQTHTSMKSKISTKTGQTGLSTTIPYPPSFYEDD